MRPRRVNDNPTSEAGLIIRSMLTGSGGGRTGLVHRLRNFSAIEAVAYQAFIIAMRRQSWRRQSEDVAARLSGWLDNAGLGFDRVTEVVGLASQIELLDGSAQSVVRISSRRALMVLLRSSTSGMSETEVDQLLATAELRVVRLQRRVQASNRNVKGPRIKLRPLDQQPSKVANERVLLPQSAAGLSIGAIARFDTGELGWVPDEDVYHFTNKLLSHALRVRFSESVSVAAVSALATKIQVVSPSLTVPVEDLVALLLTELDENSPNSTLEPEVKIQVKMAAIIGIIEEIGLFDAELDGWLVAVEDDLRSSGYHLAGAPSATSD